MNTRIKDWHNDIDENTALFVNNFKNLSEHELNWKPNPKSWSIGEVIEHLVITSNGYFELPKKIKDPTYSPSFLSKFSFYPKIIGNMILGSVKPDAKRKVKTMKNFTPSTSTIRIDILQNFLSTQKKLHTLIDENEEAILSRKIIPSPVSKHLVYHFDTVIDILVNHQERHFNQANNVLKKMKSNG